MRRAGRRSGSVWFTMLVFCVCGSAAAQQVPLIKGVVHKVGGSPVQQTEVRIEGEDSSYLTTDSGEFKLQMTANLHVGFPVVFQVKGWVILQPCEYRNGRTYLRDPSLEPIELLVLRRGDPQLLSTSKNLSIIGCLLVEGNSQIEQKPKATEGPHSALPRLPNPVFMPQGGEAVADASWGTAVVLPRYQLVEVAYHPALFQKPSSPSAQQSAASENPESDRFLAKKAKELGFTVEELKSAINEWGRSVEDPYDKGLAALQELRYAEASRYISASIPDPPGAYLTRYVPLASAEYEQGHYAAAESALRKVLAVHSDDPIVLNNLASALAKQERDSEAEPLYKQALAINEKVSGPDHPEVAVNLNNLGTLYLEQGKYNEAEALLKQALAIDEKALGPDHPRVAVDLNNLGFLYGKQGKYSEAEPLYKQALAIDEKSLGPDHPNEKTYLKNLEFLYKVLLKLSEAERVDKRILAIDEKALGPDHPEVALDLDSLGWLCNYQGKDSEAEVLFKRSLAIKVKTLGPDDLEVAYTAEYLAGTLRKLGRNSEAETYEEQAARIRAKTKQN